MASFIGNGLNQLEEFSCVAKENTKILNMQFGTRTLDWSQNYYEKTAT
jgi:hypothetical protein